MKESIELNGKNINGQSGSISYMPQSPSLLPWRTVLQNVLLGQELQGKKDKEMAIEYDTKSRIKRLYTCLSFTIIWWDETKGFFYTRFIMPTTSHLSWTSLFLHLMN